MAEILQSHLSHPVLSFYRAQRLGQSWLVSLTTVLDACALLIAGGEGLPAAQARVTYRMGLRLLVDLSRCAGCEGRYPVRTRLAEADLPTIVETFEGSELKLSLTPAASLALMRLGQNGMMSICRLSRTGS